MAVQTEAAKIDDVVRSEADGAYCRQVLTLAGSVATSIGSVLDNVPGAAILIGAGTEANSDAIAIQARSATDPRTCLCLVRGPCVVNEDALALNGAVLATIVTALETNEDIIARSEPTQTELLP